MNIRNNILIILFCLLAITQGKAQTQFDIGNGSYLADGKPIHIYSGEMHYSRIPKEYWRHRMKMVKAMGLNTIATYVFWNYHEVAPGVWDFTSENKNLAEYIKIAQEEGLYVILRPGPYVCAEWEFGGYPYWLQNNPDLQIRTNNQAFLDSCRVYLTKLAEQVADLQLSKGGNIIMTQVENEFGSYVSQREDISANDHLIYRTKIYKMLQEVGFEGPFFTSDGSWLFEGGAIDGVLPTANGEGNVNNLKKAVNKYHNDQGPYMVAEFYSGWLDHWAEEFITIGSQSLVDQTKTYLENGVDFNFYMVHGGTNFGFTSGANYNEEHDIQPDLTSYDYNAPISEAGWPTEKYMALRELMTAHVSYKIPDLPDMIPVLEIPEIKISQAYDALSYIKKQVAIKNDTPLTFEKLGQASGYVLYKKRFTQPISGKLQIKGLRDFATVYVNGKMKGQLNRVFNNYEMDINIPFNGTLEILVENLGRINYGAKITENNKGIISPVLINDYEITGNWEMYQAPFDQVPSFIDNTSPKKGNPVIYEASFKLKKTGDTFLDMSNWGKGIVYVNGHHIGRYWHVGPQQTLYIPGCWLNKGENEIVIFEQLNETQQTSLKTVRKPILTVLK
ncbi:beta-galactosidase [Fulvivirga ligni]|uniref:beta-galactosidase n=1 Tax=Fulvivirga ligni TaxID=2904246 RepID=UPI001F3710E9|nr:beta-galactosidase [Fulvivirga ligni]UII20875.1 beta-galactosidase [Fulvivirga ligni]